MFSDLKIQAADTQLESFSEPSMLAIQRSREAAERLWAEIGRLLAGDPFAPAAALPSGDRARS